MKRGRAKAFLGGLVAVAAMWLVAVPPAFAQQLEVTPGTGAKFPSRTFVVSVPRAITVTPSGVHISENAQPVADLTTTSLREATLGDLGVVLVIDSDTTMAGAPLRQAMVAARVLAAERTGSEELGVIFGDGSNLPLTTDPLAIRRFLAKPPHIVNLTNLLGATQLAIQELKAANVVAGSLIYVSDDVDKAPGITPQSLAALARAAHIRIFTVAVRDAATENPTPTDLPPQSMAILAQDSGGAYRLAIPQQLGNSFAQIEAGLTNEYIVRYRSLQSAGEQIRVTLRVDGVPGSYETTYRAPGAPSPPVSARPQRPLAAKSFWAGSLAVVLVAIACGLLVGLAVAAVVSRLTRSGRLRGRVQAFVAQPEVVIDRPAGAKRRVSMWERLLEGRRWWPAFVEQVDISSIKRSPEDLARLAVAGSLLVAVLLELITGSILIAIAGLVVGPLVLRAVVRRSVRHQRMQFAEQLSGQLHEIASAMRTGRSIVEAVEIVAANADEPMRRELNRVLADERAGLHLDQALLPIAERMESPEIEQFAVISALHRRTGANITEVLDRIADTARQRVEIRRELNTLTAQARMSRNILTALPVFVIIAIDIIGHDYERPLFHTVLGIVVLIVAGMMVLMGRTIMKSMVKIEE